MSEPIDDKVFDEYLSRQSQLSKHYRVLGADEVPAELDRRVLALAHEAVAGKPTRSHKRPAWMRWSAPLALAASAVLVVSIVIESGTQHEVTPRAVVLQNTSTSGSVAASRELAKQENASPQAPEPTQALQRAQEFQAPEASGLAAVNDSAILAAPPAPVPEKAAASPAPSVAQAAMKPLIVPVVPVTAPLPELMVDLPAESLPVTAVSTVTAAKEKRAERDVTNDKSRDLEEVAVTGMRRPVPTAGQGAGPRGTVPPVAAPYNEESDAASAQLERESDPQSWLEFIRQLRKEGKSRQAGREWKQFRAAYPEYPVDEKDAARAPK